MNPSAADCWVITDGAAGNERQALALAAQLGRRVRSLVLQPRAPWSWLAPRLVAGGRLALPARSREGFQAPWPPLAIGCGRSAALFTRMLRSLSGGACRTVQILDPRIDPHAWDLVIAPRHDALRGGNVLNPVGSLHPVDGRWLDDAREAFRRLGELPAPRLGVLVGGARRGVAMNDAFAHDMRQAIRDRLDRDGGSVMLVTSRRTPPELARALTADLPPGALIWRGEDDGANPFPGVLAWADRLLVTPDSVNMLSEACAVGVPVHTLPVRLPVRLERFHRALRLRGLLHELDTDPPLRQEPLRETARIAGQVVQRLGLDASPG